MPQMREVIPGISAYGRPSQNFSKPRNSTTWNSASDTLPSSSRKMLILAWPSMRVTGSMTMRFAIKSTKFQIRAFQLRGFATQNLNQQSLDAVRWRRAAGEEIIHVHDFVHRQHLFQQRRHDAVRQRPARVVLGALDVGALEHVFGVARAKWLRMAGTLAVTAQSPNDTSTRVRCRIL